MDIVEVAKSFGIRVNSRNFARCPFHDDSNPSLKFYPRENRYYCFGCNAHGNVYELVKKMKKVDFREALKWLQNNGFESQNNYEHQSNRKRKSSLKPAKKPISCSASDSEIYNFLYKILDLDQKGISYLRSRRIDEEVIAQFYFRTITNPTRVYKKLKNKFAEKALANAGLTGKKSTGDPYFVFWQPCLLTFFCLDDFYYIQSRNFGGSPKTTNLARLTKPIFNLKALVKSDEVWVTEGVFDALSLLSLGKAAIALIGTDINKNYLHFFEAKNVVLFLDFDEAGMTATKKICGKLWGISNSISTIATCDLKGNDPNEILAENL